jgi:sensor histidine kinase YesM
MQEDLARKTEELLKAENHRIELERQLKLVQLDALQKQVTPHFMFNVINTISRLLSLKEYNTAETMLNSFATMLRYSLSDIRSSVTLEQELEYIHNYLEIQSIRFGEQIKYHIHCDEDLKELSIPFFSLQPLVENAIQHGLLKKPEGGTLILNCTREPEYDLIHIEDDGIGMTEEDLHSIVVTHVRPDNPNKTHVGLHNSYKRFRLLFGSDLKYCINSEKGVGTRIDIRLMRQD